jgi:hypothetical protein
MWRIFQDLQSAGKVEHHKSLTKENINKGMDGQTDHLYDCSLKRIQNISLLYKSVAQDKHSGDLKQREKYLKT